jgi:hypothetical protein
MRSVLVLCAALGVVVVALATCGCPAHHRRGIEFGMSLAQARAVVGAEPCDLFELQGGVVALFPPRGPFAACERHPRREAGAAPLPAASIREIPNWYDHLQVLFDRTGRLVADTRPGEAECISTRDGPVRGECELSALSDEACARLIGG